MRGQIVFLSYVVACMSLLAAGIYTFPTRPALAPWLIVGGVGCLFGGTALLIVLFPGRFVGEQGSLEAYRAAARRRGSGGNGGAS